MKINLYYRTTHNGIPPDFLDKKQYHCSQCPEIFFNVQKFKSHESKHHGLWKPGQKLKQYQCKTCLEMFSGKRNYIAHCEKAHNEIIPLHHVDAIKCHSCEMIFSGMWFWLFFQKIDMDINIEWSKQFKWNLYFYASGQSGPFWAVVKLL